MSRKLFSGFPTRSDTNQAVQPRGIKFPNWRVEGLFYLCSKNKGTDQLPAYTAQLFLAFVFLFIWEKQVFLFKEAHVF